jgi:hypothetical protein
MLHIITPLYRPEYLEKIWYSIPANEDITWHITKSNKTDKLNHYFIDKDQRIKVYEVDCEDNEAYKKRRHVLNQIKDGYFCFLDDDTIFHENMYMKYLECKENNFIGMLIGQQIYKDGKVRLIASKPVFQKIDVGNVISHHSCLSECEWPINYTLRVNQRDFLFWESVYKFYGMKCAIWNSPISYYNSLRD